MPVDPEDAEVIKEQYNVNGYGVYVIELDDGTRCAMTTSGYGTSVDCDWTPKEKTTQTSDQFVQMTDGSYYYLGGVS